MNINDTYYCFFNVVTGNNISYSAMNINLVKSILLLISLICILPIILFITYCNLISKIESLFILSTLFIFFVFLTIEIIIRLIAKKWLKCGCQEVILKDKTLIIVSKTQKIKLLTKRLRCSDIKFIGLSNMKFGEYHLFNDFGAIFNLYKFRLCGGKILVRYYDHKFRLQNYYFCHDTDEKARICVHTLNEILELQHLTTSS